MNPFLRPQLRPQRTSIENYPRVTCLAATYAEWAAKAEAHFQAEYGRLGEHQRAAFDMLGQEIFLETHFPWNPFQSSSTRTIAVDFMIKADSPTMALAARYGAHWEAGYYMDPGYGWPVFPGDDGTERCFAFLVEWRRQRAERRRPPEHPIFHGRGKSCRTTPTPPNARPAADARAPSANPCPGSAPAGRCPL